MPIPRLSISKSEIPASNEFIRETIYQLDCKRWSRKNEMKCHASASVESEMRALNDLSREAICKLNLQAMATTKFFFKFNFKIWS